MRFLPLHLILEGNYYLPLPSLPSSPPSLPLPLPEASVPRCPSPRVYSPCQVSPPLSVPFLCAPSLPLYSAVPPSGVTVQHSLPHLPSPLPLPHLPSPLPLPYFPGILLPQVSFPPPHSPHHARCSVWVGRGYTNMGQGWRGVW